MCPPYTAECCCRRSGGVGGGGWWSGQPGSHCGVENWGGAVLLFPQTEKEWCVLSPGHRVCIGLTFAAGLAEEEKAFSDLSAPAPPPPQIFSADIGSPVRSRLPGANCLGHHLPSCCSLRVRWTRKPGIGVGLLGSESRTLNAKGLVAPGRPVYNALRKMYDVLLRE